MEKINGQAWTRRPPCPASTRLDRESHSLTWDGWWQSGNPEVAIPRWRCVCGERFTDAPAARWYVDGQIGSLFHDEDGSPTERP